MPISLQPDVVKPLMFQSMKSTRSNSLSLKVSKVNTVTRLQRYRDEYLSKCQEFSFVGILLSHQSIKGSNAFFKNLNNQIIFFLSPTFALSDGCTSPTFALVRRL